MALQNRVTPFGEIVAAPWRGALTGNRGCLHDGAGQLGAARWRTRAWIACLTAFRGRRRAPMPPGRWTALFFRDEASALAAGHRPCGECRHGDHMRFKAAWDAAGLPGRRAAEIDRVLHAARVTRDRRKITHRAEVAALPDGTMIADGETAILLHEEAAFAWSGEGYRETRRPPGRVEVLTPAPTVAVLAAGYRPMVML